LQLRYEGLTIPLRNRTRERLNIVYDNARVPQWVLFFVVQVKEEDIIKNDKSQVFRTKISSLTSNLLDYFNFSEPKSIHIMSKYKQIR
jgi:hypothetical protein